ncbi:MAG: hypothetical protein IJW70_03660 [Clostridia bacterium]|nr:hypothetical protein [Clostridia bacterium]
MKKRGLSNMILCCLLCCALCFAGCASKSPAPDRVLCALTDAEIGLPPGQIYLAGAQPHEAAYLSDDMISTLYGNGELPWQLSLVEDYGIFLSTAQHPCEFAAFLCYSRSDTDLVAAMCHARLDLLRAHYKGTEYELYTNEARVAVAGRYVLLLISSDADHALDVARRVIG